MCDPVLQIQTLGLTLRLRLHHALPGRPEISHLHSHSTFAQGHETGLRADSLDIGTTEFVLLVDELVEVDVSAERHLGSVQVEDLLLCVF
jgi:hypothetical protein